MKHLQYTLLFIILIIIAVLFYIYFYNASFSSLEKFENAYADSMMSRMNNMYRNTSFNNIMGCSDSKIKLGITIEDVLNSGMFKYSYVSDLKKKEQVNRRVCPDFATSTNGTLEHAVNSGNDECKITLDEQEYQLRSRSLKLEVFLKQSHERQLVVKSQPMSDDFLDFLLLRPIFFMVNDSMPYSLVFDNYLFATYAVPNVIIYDRFPTDNNVFSVRNEYADKNIVPDTQTKTLAYQVFNARTTKQEYAALPFVVYYLNRVTQPGDTIVMGSAKVMDLTRNQAVNTYLQNVLVGNITNPVFSLEFTVNVPPDAERETHLRQPMTVLSIAGAGTSQTTCSYESRGIITVSTRNEWLRSQPFPTKSFVRETTSANPNWTCLDFLNVSKDIANGNIVCGYDNSTQSIWVPCNEDIDIAYIVTPTMKVIVGTFYNINLQKRELIFVQNFQCEDTQNALVKTIIQLQGKLELKVTSNFGVKNVRFQCGAINLRQWYDNRKLGF